MTFTIDLFPFLAALAASASVASFLTSRFVSRKAVEEKAIEAKARAEERKELEGKISSQASLISELVGDVRRLRAEVDELRRADITFTQVHHDCSLTRQRAYNDLERSLLDKLGELQKAHARLEQSVESNHEQMTERLQAMQTIIEANLRRELGHGRA